MCQWSMLVLNSGVFGLLASEWHEPQQFFVCYANVDYFAGKWGAVSAPECCRIAIRSEVCAANYRFIVLSLLRMWVNAINAFGVVVVGVWWCCCCNCSVCWFCYLLLFVSESLEACIAHDTRHFRRSAKVVPWQALVYRLVRSGRVTFETKKRNGYFPRRFKSDWVSCARAIAMNVRITSIRAHN